MSSEGYFVQPTIPRFDDHYDHWSMLMENFLQSKEYWHIFESGVETSNADVALTETQQKELEGLKLKDLKVKNYLFQVIDRSILETILCKETSKDIWDSIKKKYEGSNRIKRAQLQALRKEFEMLHMKNDESSSLLAHEQKMNQDTIIEEQALKASTSSRGRGKGIERSGRGRGRGNQNNNSGRGDQNNNGGRGHRVSTKLPKFGQGIPGQVHEQPNSETGPVMPSDLGWIYPTGRAKPGFTIMPDTHIWHPL
ncbi:hypothetical protein GmHk_04G010107 [Glycine max]|nr:hypothetical protein GmHk_04G010107 [Glycine max]